MSYGRSKHGLDHALAMSVANAGFDVDDNESDSPTSVHGSVSSLQSLQRGLDSIGAGEPRSLHEGATGESGRVPAQHPAAPPQAAPGPPAAARADRLADLLVQYSNRRGGDQRQAHRQPQITPGEQVPRPDGRKAGPAAPLGGLLGVRRGMGQGAERSGCPLPRPGKETAAPPAAINSSSGGFDGNSRRNHVPAPPPKPSEDPGKLWGGGGYHSDGNAVMASPTPKMTQPQHQQVQHQQATLPSSLRRRNTADPLVSSNSQNNRHDYLTNSGSGAGNRDRSSSVTSEEERHQRWSSMSSADMDERINRWASLSLTELEGSGGSRQSVDNSDSRSRIVERANHDLARSAGTGSSANDSAGSGRDDDLGPDLPDCDRRGRCPKHPMVRLYRRKLLGGFDKLLLESCPRCDAEAEYEELWRGRSRDVIRGRQAERLRGGVLPPPPLLVVRESAGNHQAEGRLRRSRSQDPRVDRGRAEGQSSHPQSQQRVRPRSSSRGRGRPRSSPARKDGSQSVASPGGTYEVGSDHLTTKSLLDRGRAPLSSFKSHGGGQSKTETEPPRGRALQLGPSSYSNNAAGGGGGNDAHTVASSRSRSLVRSRSRGRSDAAAFDKKTGRCKRHPSVILAKKSTFSKGWLVGTCPHCAGAKSGRVMGQENDEFGGVDRRKMEELLGEGAGQRKTFGSNAPELARDAPDVPTSAGPAVSSSPNLAAAQGASGQSGSPSLARVSRMPFTTPWGESGWYTGQVDSTGRPHGNGRMRYKTGKQYDGEWAGGYSAEYLDNQSRMMSGFGSNTAEWRRNRTDEYGSSFRAPLDSCGEGGGRGGKGVQQQPGRESLGQKMAPCPMVMVGPAVPAVMLPLAQAAQPYGVGGGQQFYASPRGISQGIMYAAAPSQPQASPVPPSGGMPFQIPQGGQTQQQWYTQAANPAGTQAAAGAGVSPVSYPQSYRPR